ncbi:hypothetical protein D3C78_1446480 [compost metagenome]
MLASLPNAPPPGGRLLPAASIKRTPSAVSMPAPASFVADPPSPRMMRVAPALTAASISSPTPWLLARIGSRLDGEISSNPAAAAISMTAVPSSSKPQTASTL